MSKNNVRISKLLSLGLRHQPDALGITLDDSGWANVSDVIKGVKAKGYDLSHDLLKTIVTENDKQRFALSADGRKIRANQGHSVEGVDLELVAKEPPAVLYHGTSQTSIDAILASGLQKMKRHHVHLSPNIETALRVGGRRPGTVAIIVVDCARAHADGLVFYESENGVWLTDNVPAQYFVQPIRFQ